MNVAHENGLAFSVEAGGHMTTGGAILEDGLVLDLSPLKGVRVDSRAGTVRVGGGAIWEDVNHEALSQGFIPPGTPETAGVGGFTVGGGMGVHLPGDRAACDVLCEVDIVTAEGDLITASEDEHADLFWEIRGGGWNFGVITSFAFDCIEASREILVANLLYPIDDAAAYLWYFREAVMKLHDETFPIASLITVPEFPDLPAELHGELAVSTYLMGVGDHDGLSEPMETFADFGNPHVEAISPADYL